MRSVYFYSETDMLEIQRSILQWNIDLRSLASCSELVDGLCIGNLSHTYRAYNYYVPISEMFENVAWCVQL